MLAGILLGPQRVEIRETEAPRPSRGEVLVKIGAALTCGTDLKAYLRGHPMIPVPGVFGHEFSGVIAEAGKGVRGFKEGDSVMSVHSAPCLKCRYCRKRLFNLCENIMNSKVLGAFAEYILLPEHIVKQNLFHKPDGLPYEEAAFLEPLSCVVHSMAALAIRKGERVLIIGAGPIGLLHLLLAKLKGAEVIITGLEQERLALAESLGADRAVAPGELIDALREFTGGMGVDFVFECAGQVSVWEDSVSYVRRGGAVILFGGCKSGTTVTYDTYRLHYDEITLKGVFHFTPPDVKKAYALLKGTLDVSPLISGRYRLSELEIPLEKLSKGKGIKYAIIP
ncbi:MAG: zinc-binding dehydrogenase [Nitrospirae bacterium]|nr:zinc-binding dehydrogenase [Nitrospirota bacterium]MCL5422013.1 zinc-binding dehydrogenase [Nitrospirota bacterium]